MKDEQRKLRIHISYIPEDTPAVRKIYEKLQADGFQPWMDRMELLPGQDWDNAVAKSLSETDVVLVCLSRYSSQKEGVIQSEYRRIANLASEKPTGTNFLIPTRLVECEIPDLFTQYHHLDYFETDGYEKLIQALGLRSKQLGLFEPQEPTHLDEIKKIPDQQKRASALVDFARQSSNEDVWVVSDATSRAGGVGRDVAMKTKRKLKVYISITAQGCE